MCLLSSFKLFVSNKVHYFFLLLLFSSAVERGWCTKILDGLLSSAYHRAGAGCREEEAGKVAGWWTLPGFAEEEEY